MDPDRFWILTLSEYNLMMEGYLWREDQEWMRMAQLAAWVVQPHVKKPVTADQLYRAQGDQENQQKATYEESKAFFEEITKS